MADSAGKSRQDKDLHPGDDAERSSLKPVSRIPENIRLTSRDYAHPYRPFPLAAVNSIGSLFASAGLVRPMRSPDIIRAAAEKAGAPKGFDGLEHDYREGLDVLVDSIETEARLNPVGRMITRGRLIGSLAARFRAERCWEADPGILDATLAPPVVITGLQRTGTTLLHRLMAADRRFRSLQSWEVLSPAPPDSRTGKLSGRQDSRIRSAKRAEKGAAWMSPDFFAVHPIDHRAPEEDVLLLDNSFRSTVAEAILRVPSYASWLEQADSTPAYLFMRKLLLLFQATDNRPFWILKTPHHLEFLDTLVSVFPEVRVVQGHRDPAKTMGSFLSMVAHGYGMFSDSPDTGEIGRHWTRKCLRMTERGMAYRKGGQQATGGDDRFLDVQFRDLVSDPMAFLENIYRFIGIDFDATARVAAADMLESHGRYRFGRHVYDLGDFGQDAREIRSRFIDYRREYGIPDED